MSLVLPVQFSFGWILILDRGLRVFAVDGELIMRQRKEGVEKRTTVKVGFVQHFHF
jgi:hypothetical protein